MKIEKVYPAGWKMETGDDTIYFGEYGRFGNYCNEGVVYKDQKAFETGEGVCYINEYGFENSEENAGELFNFTAKACVASELEGNSYIATSGYTRADFETICDGTKYSAEELFDHVDWMSPETLMNEWLDDDAENEEEE